jgi:transcriptional regulator with XRE-family HTH domain
MPHFPDTKSAAQLLYRSRLALDMTQNELANLLGVARRTVGRWEGCESTPSVDELHRLARAVHPKDSALAAEVAVEGGITLDGLGLVAPTPAASPVSVVMSPSARPFPPVNLMIDSVVHVAAQALGAHETNDDPVRIVRAVLLAAFGRARGLGLTVEEVEGALSSKAQAKEASPSESGRGARRSDRAHST